MREPPTLPAEAFAEGLFRLGFNAMGTRCEIKYAAHSMGEADAFRKKALAWVRRFESRYSRFQEGSLISRINTASGKNPVEIDEEDTRLFDLCGTLHFLTEGLFDPTTLALSRLWDFKAENPNVPDDVEVRAALSKVGWPKVRRRGNSIYLPEKGMGLDFGGFGKEYAVDRVIEIAREHSLEHALVDFGGDICSMGKPTDSPVWHIGVEDARNSGTSGLMLGLSNQAVATSGNYQRFFEQKGRRYSHLLDHRTGYPTSNSCLSVTVVGRTCLEAGVLATCALLEGEDEGLARIDRFFGTEGCIQTESGLRWTKGFEQNVIEKNEVF